MKAQGEHIVIRKPKKKDKEGMIQLPDNFDQTYAYGKVVSVGDKVQDLLGGAGIAEGDLVVYDHHGARDLALDPHSDAEMVAAHASQVYCTIAKEQLVSRKLPIP